MNMERPFTHCAKIFRLWEFWGHFHFRQKTRLKKPARGLALQPRYSVGYGWLEFEEIFDLRNPEQVAYLLL